MSGNQYAKERVLPVAEPVLEGNEKKYVMEALSSTWISSAGQYITDFETAFAQYCGMDHGVAVSNGTVALHLALAALGIGPGDEVIVPDLTFAATINAVLYTGATPVIVDIETDSWCISPEEIEAAITPRTKAIIPVHIYGQACDMRQICAIAQKHGLKVVEDCAEAHGAEYGGKKVGSLGDIGCFSFYGNKIITTGEGGMCITNDRALEGTMRVLRDHGMRKGHRFYHEVVGFNYRMTNLQAAVGVAQLEKFKEMLAWRGALEEKYRVRLSDVQGVTLQRDDLPGRRKVTWLVSVLVDSTCRDACISRLKENGVETRPFFYPLSEMGIYQKYVFSCKNSKKIAAMGINLPTLKRMTDEDVDRISRILEICCRRV